VCRIGELHSVASGMALPLWVESVQKKPVVVPSNAVKRKAAWCPRTVSLVMRAANGGGSTAEGQGYTRKKLDDDQPPSSGAPETGA
jgi:hypothetical protein